MDPDVNWIYHYLRNTKYLWKAASTFTISSVGLISKVLFCYLNKVTYHKLSNFNDLLDNKPKDVPLITVSNHYSCFDDPGIWGCLKLKHMLSSEKMRWSLAAHDICYTNIVHSIFFMLGKSIPVVRGAGVNQEVIKFCVERLQCGEWIHIFPEGRVNMSKHFLRMKWGVGKLVYEPDIVPIVVPIWIIGSDEVLPNNPPYMFQTGKKLTINFGDPIDFSEVVNKIKKSTFLNSEHAMKLISDKIQIELLNLKIKTEELHKFNYG